MQKKIYRKAFIFDVMAFEFGSGSQCVVNVLKKCPKIPDLTQAKFLQLDLSHIHGETGK